jgi:hypothetical protein
MLLRENETINAAAELESALAAAQNDIDALRMLGQLFSVMPERVKKNLALFKEAAKKQPGDAELQEMLGELSSMDNPPGEWEGSWGAGGGGVQGCSRVASGALAALGPPRGGDAVRTWGLWGPLDSSAKYNCSNAMLLAICILENRLVKSGHVLEVLEGRQGFWGAAYSYG